MKITAIGAMKKPIAILEVSVLAGLLAALAGCGFGASSIGRDRLDYETALTVSWQRQILNNIVKLRYGDTPVFLEVGSVINQYELESLVSVNAPPWNPSAGTEFPIFGGSARYADRPTITYSPVMGEKFAKSLLSPIPPSTVMSLVQSGWPVSYVFPITVSAINGINNRSYTHFMGRKEDPQFYPLLERLRRLQLSPAVSMRVLPPKKEGEGGETTLLLLGGRSMDDAVKEDLKTVLATLGLNPHAAQINLVYGLLPADDHEIALQTRSVIEIFGELAGGIDVPASHVAEQRVRSTRYGKGSPEGEFEPLMRIHSGPDRPEQPFISIRYRDHWFWVDDRDLTSKFMFTFLMLLTNLAEKGVVPASPLLTIPSGR
jgi:hypothetical protein